MNTQSYEQLPLSLTVPELAQALRIGRNSAYQLVNDGIIRSIRVGRSIRIPRTAVMQFLENPALTYIIKSISTDG